jgi:hypothetical protein
MTGAARFIGDKLAWPYGCRAITKPAVWLIPAGRVSGLAVTGIAGVLLSRAVQPRSALPDPD